MSSFNHRGSQPFFREPEELPLILCGPILRRVTPTSVAVFVALRAEAEISLRLYEGADKSGPLPPGDFQSTVRIGRYVHLRVVTIDLPQSGQLAANKVYGYDLVFRSAALPAGGEHALSDDADHKLLAAQPSLEDAKDDKAITYGDDLLPTFVVPPKSLAELRLVHGSCRKPHGQGPDMLAMLDDLLRVRRGNPTNHSARPQLLVLTGDQIYADDVSPVLLRCLNDSMQVLLDWRETVPCPQLQLPPGISWIPRPDMGSLDEIASDGTWTHTGFTDVIPHGGIDAERARKWVEETFDPTRASRIAPTQRGREVIENGGLSTQEPEAHLVFFGEFLLMYLFVWSDALWPRNGAELRLPKPAEAVPTLSLFGKFDQLALQDQREALTAFWADLPKVRRALANTPTLMIFDDHDVTDDWNLNQDWAQRVNLSPAGPRILRNALVAYALCQDWGNQPEDYEQATEGQNEQKAGAQILQAVTCPAPDQGQGRATWGANEPPPIKLDGPRMAKGAPESLYPVLGIGPDHWDKEPGKTWHFAFNPWSGDEREYQMLFLDTRTRRDFPKQFVVDEAASSLKSLIGDHQPMAGLVLDAGLLSKAAHGAQLTDRIDKTVVNLIVSPAPLFSTAFENLVQRLLVAACGPERSDNELWSGNQAAFGRLIETLRTAKKGSVILSGDVHYAFTQEIRFPDGTGGELPFSTVQLCASANKNQAMFARLLALDDPRADPNHVTADLEPWVLIAGNRYLEMRDTLERMIEEKLVEMRLEDRRLDEAEIKWFLVNYAKEGWFDPTPAFYDPIQVLARLRDLNPFTLPEVFQLPIRMIFGLSVGTGIYDWVHSLLRGMDGGFKVSYLGDTRLATERDEEVLDINAGLRAPPEVMEFALEQNRKIVGFNNLGEISFKVGAETSVRHELYWPAHDTARKAYAAYIATRHEARVAA